jgi:heme oxygenase (biliverdin-producing, ferredoxin)
MTESGFGSAVREAILAERDRVTRPVAPDGVMSDAYVASLAQRYVIEELLEQAAAGHRDNPTAGRFVAPELHRGSAIAADLARLAGPQWREEVRVMPATRTYADRLREVAFTWPGGFVAHYCLRYLEERGLEARWGLFDTAPWDETERARILAEARLAVRLSAAILDELTQEATSPRVA